MKMTLVRHRVLRAKRIFNNDACWAMDVTVQN